MENIDRKQKALDKLICLEEEYADLVINYEDRIEEYGSDVTDYMIDEVRRNIAKQKELLRELEKC